MVFMYFNEKCSNYVNEVFDVATEINFQLRSKFQNLKCHFRKTNSGHYALSYICPPFWNQTLKCSKKYSTF